MPSIEEIESWSIDTILAEIKRLLPPGTSFVEGSRNGWIVVTVQKMDAENPDEKIMWSDNGPDRRLLLLNAFGWLWVRTQKPRHPAWKPRPGGMPTRPHPAPLNFQGPPDLDPANIRAVYEKGPKRK